MFELNGLRITIAQPYRVYKLSLSNDFDCSQEFRESVNDWCWNLFGGHLEETIKGDDIYHFKANNTLVMNNTTACKIKQKIETDRLAKG